MERNMEYAHRLYASKVKRKYGATIEYSPVIQFNLNNFAFEGNDKVVDKYVLQNEEGIRLNNKLIFIQIYIPNLRRKCYNEGKDNLSKEERCALALIERDIELSKALGKGDAVMEEYVREKEEVSNEEFFGESYDKEWALKDEGKQEGKEEEKLEIASALLKKGIDIQTIAECTGLNWKEVEELK